MLLLGQCKARLKWMCFLPLHFLASGLLCRSSCFIRCHVKTGNFQWKLLDFTENFYEILWISWNLPIFSGFQHENWWFSHWLLERSFSRCVSFYFWWFSHWNLPIFTENHQFSWNLTDFMKSNKMSFLVVTKYRSFVYRERPTMTTKFTGTLRGSTACLVNSDNNRSPAVPVWF